VENGARSFAAESHGLRRTGSCRHTCAYLQPAPIFLKVDRMVPILEEGTSLPAKCQVKLRRAFAGPRMEIPIYMEDEQVGVLSADDIPEEAGEGSLVVVDVEVTANNEMRGKVLVYAPDGRTVLKEGPCASLSTGRPSRDGELLDGSMNSRANSMKK